MKIEQLNYFNESITKIFGEMVGEKPTIGRYYLKNRLFRTTGEFAVVIGVTGRLNGQVVMSMSNACAESIAAKMVGENNGLDELGKSAVAELTDILVSNAMTGLSEEGFMSEITPPYVIDGSELSLLNCSKSLVVPMFLGEHRIEICVSLRDSEEKRDVA